MRNLIVSQRFDNFIGGCFFSHFEVYMLCIASFLEAHHVGNLTSGNSVCKTKGSRHKLA